MSNRYDKSNIETMELLYGRGYLSMGGDAEVARIVAPINLRGSCLLDVGCGMGGAAITLARDHGADKVIGIDIDAGLLERAGELVEAAGLGDRVEVIQVEPGPLPFVSASFDIVYFTAVSCHIENLTPFLQEIRRVLRPGGYAVGGEWFIHQDNEAYRRWDKMLRDRGLNFYFLTRAQFIDAFEEAGYDSVEFDDQSGRTAELAAGYLAHTQGDLRETLVERMGQHGYAAHLEWTRIRAEGLARGGSGYGHFVARRPLDQRARAARG